MSRKGTFAPSERVFRKRPSGSVLEQSLAGGLLWNKGEENRISRKSSFPSKLDSIIMKGNDIKETDEVLQLLFAKLQARPAF